MYIKPHPLLALHISAQRHEVNYGKPLSRNWVNQETSIELQFITKHLSSMLKTRAYSQISSAEITLPVTWLCIGRWLCSGECIFSQHLDPVPVTIFIFWFKHGLARSTMYPKFNPTEVWTYDLQIMNSTFYVPKTATLLVVVAGSSHWWPSG